MKRIVILGGGVGGTLDREPPRQALRREIERGEVDVTVVDATGRHVYQPGFMYIAMGGERAERLERPERSLLDRRVALVVGEVVGSTRATSAVDLATARCWTTTTS